MLKLICEKGKDRPIFRLEGGKVALISDRYNYSTLPKPGEEWECELIVEKERFAIVRPLRRITTEKVERWEFTDETLRFLDSLTPDPHHIGEPREYELSVKCHVKIISGYRVVDEYDEIRNKTLYVAWVHPQTRNKVQLRVWEEKLMAALGICGKVIKEVEIEDVEPERVEIIRRATAKYIKAIRRWRSVSNTVAHFPRQEKAIRLLKRIQAREERYDVYYWVAEKVAQRLMKWKCSHGWHPWAGSETCSFRSGLSPDGMRHDYDYMTVYVVEPPTRHNCKEMQEYCEWADPIIRRAQYKRAPATIRWERWQKALKRIVDLPPPRETWHTGWIIRDLRRRAVRAGLEVLGEDPDILDRDPYDPMVEYVDKIITEEINRGS